MDDTANDVSSEPAAAIEPLDPIDLTANIVAAYVSNNSVRAADLPALLVEVHRIVASLANGSATSAPQPAAEETKKPTLAQVRKSITPDAIVSFIDGKPYKTMKRHLGFHGLDPHGYRQRYGLPSDYPMVAPSYAAMRSELARSNGLGRSGGLARSRGETDEQPAAEPKKRGRKAAE